MLYAVDPVKECFNREHLVPSAERNGQLRVKYIDRIIFLGANSDMIIHAVFCKYKSDVSEEEIERLMQELLVFSKELNGVEGFYYGVNRDFENMSASYPAGFVIHFRDQSALEYYAQHSTHQELAKRLQKFCEGGCDGIIVFDLETTSTS